MNKLFLMLYLALLLITGQAISADADLENSKFVITVDKNNAVWWGKFLYAEENVIKINVFPENKLSFMNSPNISVNASIDKVFPCLETNKKVVITKKDGRKSMINVQLSCTNGFVAQISGRYFAPHQFVEEVDQIGGFKRGTKILTSNGKEAFVRRVFSDGSIDSRIGSLRGYLHLDDIKRSSII